MGAKKRKRWGFQYMLWLVVISVLRWEGYENIKTGDKEKENDRNIEGQVLEQRKNPK